MHHRHRKKIARQPYDESGDAKGKYSTHFFTNDVLPEIKEHIIGSVLDVGCGNGRLSHLISKYADSVRGIDPYEIQLDKYKNKNITYESVNLQDFSTSNVYDCILFWGVFYLLHDSAFTFTRSYPEQEEYHLKMLQKCKDMLSSEGSIIIIDHRRRKINYNKPTWGYYNLDEMCKKLKLKNIKEFFGMGNLRVSIIKNEK